jgi:cyclase
VVASGDLLFAGYHFNYEEASVEGLLPALDRLAALGGARLVPGHGPVGGPELVAAQRAHHEAMARLARAAPSDGAVERAVLAAFPGLKLAAAAGSAVTWRG